MGCAPSKSSKSTLRRRLKRMKQQQEEEESIHSGSTYSEGEEEEEEEEGEVSYPSSDAQVQENDNHRSERRDGMSLVPVALGARRHTTPSPRRRRITSLEAMNPLNDLLPCEGSATARGGATTTAEGGKVLAQEKIPPPAAAAPEKHFPPPKKDDDAWSCTNETDTNSRRTAHSANGSRPCTPSALLDAASEEGARSSNTSFGVLTPMDQCVSNPLAREEHAEHATSCNGVTHPQDYSLAHTALPPSFRPDLLVFSDTDSDQTMIESTTSSTRHWVLDQYNPWVSLSTAATQ